LRLQEIDSGALVQLEITDGLELVFTDEQEVQDMDPESAGPE
jgi:hypothetical protein